MSKFSDRQELLGQAQEVLLSAISRIPTSSKPKLVATTGDEPGHPDLVARLSLSTGRKSLACRVLPKLFPKDVLATTLLLKRWVSRSGAPDGYPVVIAPFISPQSAGMLAEEGVGFVDLAGNFRLAFDQVFLEREVPGNPMRERREVRGLFTPQAARVLLTLLTRQGPWQGTHLAKESGVSMGYVSGLKQTLSNHEWIRSERTRIELVQPEALLEAWRAAFDPPKALPFYTTLHGQRLAARLPEVLAPGKALLAGPSAADHIAPYLRTSTVQLICTRAALDTLTATLELQSTSKGGANVLVEQADEADMRFSAQIERGSGILTTDPVSTYLSLWSQGERMQEAAEHLRSTCLSPLWQSWLTTSEHDKTSN